MIDSVGNEIVCRKQIVNRFVPREFNILGIVENQGEFRIFCRHLYCVDRILAHGILFCSDQTFVSKECCYKCQSSVAIQVNMQLIERSARFCAKIYNRCIDFDSSVIGKCLCCIKFIVAMPSTYWPLNVSNKRFSMHKFHVFDTM